MKKSSKSSLKKKKKKRSPDISVQHKNQASYKFSKKYFSTWPKKGLEIKGLTSASSVTRNVFATGPHITSALTPHLSEMSHF